MSAAPHILLVDDDDLIAKAVERYFRRNNVCTSVRANCGNAAARLLRDGARFDGIVCDVSMPLMNGPSFYQWLDEFDPQLLDRFVFHTNDPALVKGHKAPVVTKCDFTTLKNFIQTWTSK